MSTYKLRSSACGRVPRRTFLADVGMGFTGLALGAMLHRAGFASDAGGWSPPNGLPHFAPKAKSVIWLFMIGGVSHLESFDPKPALNQYAANRSAKRRSNPFSTRTFLMLTFVRLCRISEKSCRSYFHSKLATVSAARVGSKSAIGGRMLAPASTISPLSVRCGPTTSTTVLNFNSTRVAIN
jgi:hypothetical protein